MHQNKERARLVGVARGNGDDPHTASGTAKGLFDALARRFPLEDRVDVGLAQPQRAATALLALHPDRSRWRQRHWLSPLGFELMSRNALHGLAPHRRDAIAVQIYGMFQTRGVPYVMYIDTTQAMAARDWPEWSPFNAMERRRWLKRERETYRDALHVFCASTAAARSVMDDYGQPHSKVSVVGAGSNFFPLPAPRERSHAPEILFIGREWERKGGPELIEAFGLVREEVPEARLTIVGTTDAPSGPGIEVVGKLMDRAALAARFEAAAIYTVPSRFCPFTNSLMEAMAYSLPCVSTTTAGVPELVLHGETGLLVEPRDATGLAEALLTLLRNPALADAMGAAGRLRVEQELTWDRVAERMEPALAGFGAAAAPRLVAV